MEKKKLIIKDTHLIGFEKEPFMTVYLCFEAGADSWRHYVQASEDQERPYWLPLGVDQSYNEDDYEEILQFVQDYFSESAD